MSVSEFDFMASEPEADEGEWGEEKVLVVAVDHQQPFAPRATLVRYRHDEDQLGRLARLILMTDGSAP